MGGIPHAGSQQTWNSFTAPQNSPAFSFCNDKLPYSCVVLCLVTQLCPTLLDPTDCSPPRILCPRGFSRQEYWNGFSCPPKGDLSNLELKLRFPSLQADSLLTELPGKPMNTGVGSLPLLQQTFPTQESNWGLLHLDAGDWWAAVCGVSKGRTRLSDFTFTFHFHALEKEMATHSSILA